MNTKELIKQGDILFKTEEFEQAFSFYHQAHMQKDPLGTYKVAECFRVAFLQANTDNIYYKNQRDYAFKAIDCYKNAYRRLKSKKILMRLSFMHYLVSSDYYELSEPCIKTYVDYLSDPFALFLLAVNNHEVKIDRLRSIIEDYDFPKSIKLCACFEFCSNIIRIRNRVGRVWIKHSSEDDIYNDGVDKKIFEKIEFEYSEDFFGFIDDADFVARNTQEYCDKEFKEFVDLANSLGATLDYSQLEYEEKYEEKIEREFYPSTKYPRWYDEVHSTPYPTESSLSSNWNEEDDVYNYDDGPDDIGDVYDYYSNADYDGYGEDY